MSGRRPQAAHPKPPSAKAARADAARLRATRAEVQATAMPRADVRSPVAARAEARVAPVTSHRGLDRVAVVRGASRGFSVLVLGEMVLRVAGPSQQQFGLLFALLGAAGFTMAGIRGARTAAARPVLTGATAAVAAFVLTVPLRMMLHAPVLNASTGISMGYAAVVGAVAGLLARRARPSGAQQQ